MGFLQDLLTFQEPLLEGKVPDDADTLDYRIHATKAGLFTVLPHLRSGHLYIDGEIQSGEHSLSNITGSGMGFYDSLKEELERRSFFSSFQSGVEFTKEGYRLFGSVGREITTEQSADRNAYHGSFSVAYTIDEQGTIMSCKLEYHIQVQNLPATEAGFIVVRQEVPEVKAEITLPQEIFLADGLLIAKGGAPKKEIIDEEETMRNLVQIFKKQKVDYTDLNSLAFLSYLG